MRTEYSSTACLVCFISTVNGHHKKPCKTGASSGHITNLKQSILETFDICLKEFAPVLFENIESKRPITRHLIKQKSVKKVHYSALFTNLVRWHASAVSLPLNNVILAQLACTLSDVMFCLHSGITNLSLYKH